MPARSKAMEVVQIKQYYYSFKPMIGMSQQDALSTGIKVSQSPGGKSSFAFSYEQVPPRPIKRIVSAGKAPFTLAWDQSPKNTCSHLPLKHPTQSSISLAWDSKESAKKIHHLKHNHVSPEVRNFYESGKVVQRAGSPKLSTVRVNCPPGGHSSIKIG